MHFSDSMELVVCGGLLPLMKPEGGRTEQQWRTWILLSEQVSRDGNSSILVTFRASDFPREYDGVCVQMIMSYSPVSIFFLFFVQWSDCHLAGALGLLILNMVMEQVLVTMVSDLDFRRNDNNIRVKVMRTWRLPDMKMKNEDYSIEMILMDEQGSKIQANVVRKWFFRFAKFLTEGACLLIKRPSIGINNSKYKLCNNPNKLSLNYNTYVFECDDFNGPTYGFELASFGSILKKDCQCHVVVDIIGHVTRFFKTEVPISKDVNDKARLTMEVTDLENNTLYVTLWDKYAHQMASHVSDNPNADHVIIILQFAWIKFHNEKAYVSNSFGEVSILFINNDIDEIISYNKSLIQKAIDNPGCVPPPYGASMFFSVRDDFLNNISFSSIDEICEIFEPKVVIIVGSVKDVFKEVDWYYMGCDKCSRKLVETYVAYDPEDGNGEFKEVLECKNPKCNSHVVTPVPKFKV